MLQLIQLQTAVQTFFFFQRLSVYHFSERVLLRLRDSWGITALARNMALKR